MKELLIIKKFAIQIKKKTKEELNIYKILLSKIKSIGNRKICIIKIKNVIIIFLIFYQKVIKTYRYIIYIYNYIYNI
jgi:hypothetical protein